MTSFEPLVVEAIGARPDGGVGWTVALSGSGAGSTGSWLVVRHDSFSVPEQGWKLHVSAGVGLAAETLRRVLPVVLAEPVALKVAASAAALAALNDGFGALSQVGKFVTVYPADDEQAVRLATALADATSGLHGPAVPSDRPLRSGCVVHYRYGSFGGLIMQRPNGEMVFAVRTSTGELVPDIRGSSFAPPGWVVDPFVEAGVAGELPEEVPLVADRFLVVSPLHQSSRGAITLAVDLDQPRTCVLKQARGAARRPAAGDDAGERLCHEAEVLRKLSDCPGFPALVGVVADGDDLYLAMTDMEGETLERHVLALNRQGRHVPVGTAVALGRELASLVASVHSTGLVYRDLKSTNVMVGPDGSLRLIDFELACSPGSTCHVPGLGTRGYISPQQAAGEPPAFTDDVHGLGAVLYFILTGAEPSQAPDPLALLDRPIRLLNPAVPAAVEAVVARCLARDPRQRPQSSAEVGAALGAAGAVNEPAGPPVAGARPQLTAGESLDLARRLGDSICRAALAGPPHDRGLRWVSEHPLTAGMTVLDINTGAAGTLLALAELVDAVGDPVHRAVLARGAEGLAAESRPPGDPLPGLYVGESGVALALLRAGQVLGDSALEELAAERSRSVARLPHRSPDLFCGSAGRLRTHLVMWERTGDSAELSAAVAAGEHLIDRAEDAGDGALFWTIPPGYGGTSGRAYVGYAHGAAGIADALLDLHDATAEPRWADAARGAARWIAGLAQPVLDDDTGLNWPATAGEDVAAPHWCHGATGVGQFFLHAAQTGLLSEASDIAACAMATVARGARWAPPPLCHGLAGSIEALVDAFQATRDQAHLDNARELGALMAAFVVERDGRAVCQSESPLVVTPDYLVGYAGVAATLLRLAEPDRRARVLSRASFSSNLLQRPPVVPPYSGVRHAQTGGGEHG